MNNPPETALSVAGVTEYLQLLLEDDAQLNQLWVTGEVSSLQDHRVGLFFTLSDSQGQAAIKCVVWNGQKGKLLHCPKLGSQIFVNGSVRLYPKKGEYQLTVFQAIETGDGLQTLRYQQLRSRLQAEGLFDLERKRSLPPYPQTIAVVSALTAAAWGDIQRTLVQRNPGLHVLLSPATVQGTEAPSSIERAIRRVAADGRAEVLILARGGGAVEDLFCFNDERVVRAISESPIPVITGIGHQRDETLADLVADATAHTPTAAAEMAVPSYSALLAEHQHRQGRLLVSLERRLRQESDRLGRLKTRLKNLPASAASVRGATVKIHLLQQKLQALDPNAVLKRGFSLVRTNDGEIVRDSVQLSEDLELVIQLPQGSIKVKVTEILPE